ncbi:hypothetical protein FJ366_00685 [Candidatus Dependentiae bacterium]|nr:hypothetical protein [Candidatus Dependentiae bacterium]
MIKCSTLASICKHLDCQPADILEFRDLLSKKSVNY